MGKLPPTDVGRRSLEAYKGKRPIPAPHDVPKVKEEQKQALSLMENIKKSMLEGEKRVSRGGPTIMFHPQNRKPIHALEHRRLTREQDFADWMMERHTARVASCWEEPYTTDLSMCPG